MATYLIWLKIQQNNIETHKRLTKQMITYLNKEHIYQVRFFNTLNFTEFQNHCLQLKEFFMGKKNHS